MDKETLREIARVACKGVRMGTVHEIVVQIIEMFEINNLSNLEKKNVIMYLDGMITWEMIENHDKQKT